ncbi:MAG: hypothetical protein AAFN79_06025 [Pseudomonadota bacterium]
MDFFKNAVMMNNAVDSMELSTGIALGGGRMPIAEIARAMQKPQAFNNIKIANSQIGVVNTGSIEKIDAAITLSQGSDVEIAARGIKNLTQSVLDAEDLLKEDKQEVVDLIESLSSELVGSRKKATVFAILKEIGARVGEFASTAKAFNELHSVLSALF